MEMEMALSCLKLINFLFAPMLKPKNSCCLLQSWDSACAGVFNRKRSAMCEVCVCHGFFGISSPCLVLIFKLFCFI